MTEEKDLNLLLRNSMLFKHKKKSFQNRKLFFFLEDSSFTSSKHRFQNQNHSMHKHQLDHRLHKFRLLNI